METEAIVSLQEAPQVLDNFAAEHFASNLQTSDLQAAATQYVPETHLQAARLAHIHKTNIKTHHNDNIKKIYEAKNLSDIEASLCRNCKHQHLNKVDYDEAGDSAGILGPVFKVATEEVYITIQAMDENSNSKNHKKQGLIVRYYCIANGQLFQEKIMAAKKLRKNLSDIIFGRPGSLELKLQISNGVFGLQHIEVINRKNLSSQLKYFMAFL